MRASHQIALHSIMPHQDHATQPFPSADKASWSASAPSTRRKRVTSADKTRALASLATCSRQRDRPTTLLSQSDPTKSILRRRRLAVAPLQLWQMSTTPRVRKSMSNSKKKIASRTHFSSSNNSWPTLRIRSRSVVLRCKRKPTRPDQIESMQSPPASIWKIIC